MISIDLERVQKKVARKNKRIPYRNALAHPYGDEKRNTRTQKLAWEFLLERTGTGPLIAMIGAKGSSKTHFGACFALHQGQKFPGSTGCLIANTYGQTKTSIAPLLKKVCRQVGFDATYYSHKKINGQPMQQVMVINEGTPSEFYLLMRSFENIETIEGVELDWLWVEEGQDADREDFIVVFSRVRGQNADNAIFYAAMPESPFHWQYKLLPELGFILEGEPGHAETGVMYWPKLRENAQNLPKSYIPRMVASHTGDLARRYIEGLPSLLDGSLTCYNYDDHLHRRGRMSKLLCHYDESMELIFAIDFNVRQMCCSVWQVKGWNDLWADERVVIMPDNTIRVYEDADVALRKRNVPFTEYPSLGDYAAPDREVLAQVDELQLFTGGTRALAETIVMKYGEHSGGLVLLGDASGNRRESSSDTTDWQILTKAVRTLPNTRIIRGLKSRNDLKTGVTTYSNPSKPGSINILNYYLQDGHQRVRICFLPESKEENSGVAGSLSRIENDASGEVDSKIDKHAKRHDPVTHWLDGVRYLVVYHNGSDTVLPLDEGFKATVGNLEEIKAGGQSTFAGAFS
jgi:hypothetical protein